MHASEKNHFNEMEFLTGFGTADFSLACFKISDNF